MLECARFFWSFPETEKDSGALRVCSQHNEQKAPPSLIIYKYSYFLTFHFFSVFFAAVSTTYIVQKVLNIL